VFVVGPTGCMCVVFGQNGVFLIFGLRWPGAVSFLGFFMLLVLFLVPCCGTVSFAATDMVHPVVLLGIID
jgi:hypothetical protein